MSEVERYSMEMASEPQYVMVADSEDTEDAMELPAEEDGTLLLTTIQAQFPGSLGLKYRSPSGTSWRGIRLADGALHPPVEGWASNTYVITMPKTDSVKRKLEESPTREPEAKLVKTASPEYSSKQDLIVLGLSFAATEGDMRSYFEQFGEVTMSEVKKDMQSGKSRGFGFIRFADPAVTKSVLNRTHTIAGRRAEVKRPKSKEVPNKLFVGRLPPDTNESELKEFFEKFGETSDVYIPKPYRGFCFITFQDPEDAQTVMNLTSPLKLKDHQLNITYAEPKQDKPFGGGGRGGMMESRSMMGSRGMSQRGGRGGYQSRGSYNNQQDGPFDFEDMMKMFNNSEKMQAFASFMNSEGKSRGKGSSGYSSRSGASSSSSQQQQDFFRGTDYSNYNNYYSQQ